MWNINEFIFSTLELKGKSRTEFAKYIGVEKKYIENLKARGSDPACKYLPKIAEFFDVSTDYLLTGELSNKVNTALNADELNLLEEFRQLDPQERRIIWGKIAEMNYNKRGNIEITEEIGIHFPTHSRMPR